MTDDLPQNRTEPQPGLLRRPLVRGLILAAILAMLLAAYFFIKAPALDLTNFSLERQSKSFLLVSALKSSLAIIEGSDVGVGFHLQLGDMVQSVYDLVDFTWKMLLYGVLLITLSKIFFETNLIDVGPYLLGFGFLLRIISLFMLRSKIKLQAVGSGVAIAGMIVSFYIPVSTFVSFRASEYFVARIEANLDTQVEEVTQEWESFKEDFSLRKLKDSFQVASGFIRDLFLKLTRILMTYTCLIIIRYLLFPIVVAYGFFIVARLFLHKSLA